MSGRVITNRKILCVAITAIILVVFLTPRGAPDFIRIFQPRRVSQLVAKESEATGATGEATVSLEVTKDLLLNYMKLIVTSGEVDEILVKSDIGTHTNIWATDDWTIDTVILAPEQPITLPAGTYKVTLKTLKAGTPVMAAKVKVELWGIY